ncbi:MAG TPA: PD-(D/E)XK nuclease family protein [Pelolinea sp.]|nr:PD-(D/E)XK nuclease family protein [Pelolinea sp.]
MAENWKLSPSDLTFLWDECRRCFYLKVRHNFRRPSAPFPKIFGMIDLLMKDIYLGQSTKKISPLLPEGKSILSGRWVTSQPFGPETHPNSCYISGIFDTLVKFEDDSYGIVDFKTTAPADHHVGFYGRQLHAYAYALENAAPGKLNYAPINLLGLLCFDPGAMDENPASRLNLSGPAAWVNIPVNRDGFLEFLDEVLTLLELPEPPAPHPDCAFCSYRDAARNTAF